MDRRLRLHLDDEELPLFGGGRGDLTDILYQRGGEIIALQPPDPAVAGMG